MVAIDLDPAQEAQLRALAQSQGANVPEVARRIVEDYLNFLSLEDDSPEMWAESSAQLAGEILADSDLSPEENGGLT